MIEYRAWITRGMLRSEKNVLFVFGDNLMGTGFGGQAKEMRGEPNAVGIPTKALPGMQRGCFFSDEDAGNALPTIDAGFDRLKAHLQKGGKIVWPKNGIGTGLALLAEKSPLIWNHIEERRKDLEATVELMRDGLPPVREEL